MKNNQAAYEHYCALCIGEGIAPLSFEGWSMLCNGEIPDELTKRRKEFAQSAIKATEPPSEAEAEGGISID